MRLTLSDYDKKVQAPEKKKKEDIPSFAQSPRGFILELVKIVLIALAVIIPIRYFLFQPFYVRGASMEPAFHDYEYLIIDEITYRFADPQRGEVVVIKNPQNPSEYFIKRIIGLPNETVEIKNGNVDIYSASHPSGFTLAEPYLAADIRTNGNVRVTLGKNEYYILGDNRPVSLDSRIFGQINRKNIVGRAWLRVWPLNEFQHFTMPQYNYNLNLNINNTNV